MSQRPQRRNASRNEGIANLDLGPTAPAAMAHRSRTEHIRQGEASGRRDRSRSTSRPRQSSPFRSLNLPAELRDEVYDYVVCDDAPRKLNLLDAPPYRRIKGLMHVSKQLQSETVGFYQKAMSEFWRNHAFHVCIDDSFWNDDNAETLIRKWVASIPFRVVLPSLGFVATFRPERNLRYFYAWIEMMADDNGTVTWRICNLPPTNIRTQLQLNFYVRQLELFLTSHIRLGPRQNQIGTSQWFTKADIVSLFTPRHDPALNGRERSLLSWLVDCPEPTAAWGQRMTRLQQELASAIASKSESERARQTGTV